MKLALVAIGRLKAGPERDLVERYRGRIGDLARPLGLSPLDLFEYPEARDRSAPERLRQEGAAILSRAPGAVLVAFDERGTSMSSEDWAGRLGGWRDGGRPTLLLAVGGADGLAEEVRARADLVLSFGRLTLPHQLVRVLVCEQLYRVLTILAGHPYHRGEPTGSAP